MKDEARKVYAAWAKEHPEEVSLVYNKAKGYNLNDGKWCVVVSGNTGCSKCPFLSYNCSSVSELREVVLSFWEQEDI